MESCCYLLSIKFTNKFLFMLLCPSANRLAVWWVVTCLNWRCPQSELFQPASERCKWCWSTVPRATMCSIIWFRIWKRCDYEFMMTLRTELGLGWPPELGLSAPTRVRALSGAGVMTFTCE